MASADASPSPFKDWMKIKTTVWLIRLTGLSSKTIQLGADHLVPLHGNYILATWHSNIYLSCWLLKDRHYGSLTSQSRDGEFIAKVMEHFAFVPIRGSSSKGGARAVREMVKYLKGPHPVALTPDGPQGPRHKAQSGVILLAKMSGMPIVPWACDALDQWIAQKSWDQHKIPQPCTIMIHAFGAPFHVPSQLSREEMEAYCEKLEQALKDNHAHVSEKMAELNQAGANRFLGKLCLMRSLKR